VARNAGQRAAGVLGAVKPHHEKQEGTKEDFFRVFVFSWPALMRIIVVAATAAEIAPLVAELRGRDDIDVLTTGVGMVATAARCAQALSRNPYQLALNFGVCGSFDRSLPPGTVVHVVSDRIAELGAEDGAAFLTVQQMGLLGADEFPFTTGKLVNVTPPANAVLRALPTVSGITVNTVHGKADSIAAIVERFQPQVESMEGAAFMYACLIHDVPFAQVRAVSNVVERRNREAWKLAEAIDSLNAVARSILDQQ
jgi:futalosine hydrolase